MSDNTALNALTEHMAREGIRRLLIISGEGLWPQERALALRNTLPGDWLWVGQRLPLNRTARRKRYKRYWGVSFAMRF